MAADREMTTPRRFRWPVSEHNMRDVALLALAALLFLAWGLSYLVFRVAGVLIHLLLVLALVSMMFHAFSGKRTAPR
ncbi:MAG: hypothetical protein JWO71_21 [Candidatus Acidoferrum typicum]|nr:hypothetical protein [Candidatus Acidoferrum typicum]